MRELVTNSWCDSCYLEDRTKVAAVHTFTVGAVAGESRPALDVSPRFYLNMLTPSAPKDDVFH